MKSVFIIFLASITIFLGFSVSALWKELLSAREHTALLEERDNKLHMELMRLNRILRSCAQGRGLIFLNKCAGFMWSKKSFARQLRLS